VTARAPPRRIDVGRHALDAMGDLAPARVETRTARAVIEG
jgi:hypothetical protein